MVGTAGRRCSDVPAVDSHLAMAGVAACGKSAAEAGFGAVRAVCAGGVCWCAHLWAVLALTDVYLPELARGQGVPVGYGLMMDAG